MTNENKDKDENLGSFYMGRMRPPPKPERTLPRGALTAIAVLAFGAIIWYAYPQGAEKYTDMDVPVVTADTTPYKSKPADPGGMVVPHRDSTVFETLDKKAAAKTEKIKPKQEEPLDKTKLALDTKKPLNLEPQTKVTAAPAPAPAVEKPAAKPEAAKVSALTAAATATGKTFIQLGSYRDTAGASTDWAKLQKKYPQYFKGLKMKTEKVDIPKKGIFYRLQAGGVTEARAHEICADLAKANPGGCVLVK